MKIMFYIGKTEILKEKKNANLLDKNKGIDVGVWSKFIRRRHGTISTVDETHRTVSKLN